MLKHNLLHWHSVKQIIAVVKPYLAEKVVEALHRAPLEALSVREVKGYGRQKRPSARIRPVGICPGLPAQGRDRSLGR